MEMSKESGFLYPQGHSRAGQPDGEGQEEETHLAQITQVLQRRETQNLVLCFPPNAFGLGAENTLSYSHVCWPL